MVEQVQHKFSQDPKLKDSPLCTICQRPWMAAIHTPKATVIQGTITPKKIG